MKSEEVEILQNQIMREHEQYNDLVHDSIDDLKTIRTYKQALEEIKKWATNHTPCDIEAAFNCTIEDCFKCLNYDIKKIIKIINEVLNDRD